MIRKKTLYILTIIILLILVVNYCNYSSIYLENFSSIKRVFIVTSLLGKGYAKRIREEMLNINSNLDITIMNVREFEIWCKNKNNRPFLIIVRSATPENTNWMICLKELEKEGVKIYNPPHVLQLTSNKLTSSIHLIKKGVPHPDSKRGAHNSKETLKIIRNMLKKYNKVIVKPFTSSDQGKYVQKISYDMSDNEITNKINQIPKSPFVIQEYIQYKAIYRIIVVNNKALPLAYKDTPTLGKWKVSVCLNPNMKFVSDPPSKLLRTAEQVQRAILNGGVHFIDLFEKEDGNYVVSEINTACSLLLHEKMAKMAKHTHYNIAYYLAKYYISLLD